MIKLRPHHLLCINFYIGKGYSDGFTSGMDYVVSLLKQNPEQIVRLVNSGDDICGGCPKFCGSCADAEKSDRYDEITLKLTNLSFGEIQYIKAKNSVIENIVAKGLLKTVCGDCEWLKICEKLAE